MALRGLLGLIFSAIGITAALFVVQWKAKPIAEWPLMLTLFGTLLAVQLAILFLMVLQFRRKRYLLPGLSLSESKSLHQYREEIEREMEAEATRLDQQSRKLADRYRMIHEWMDYPQMLDLKTGEALPGQLITEPPQFTVAERDQITRQDRRVAEILDKQAGLIYEKVRNNAYSPQGFFEALLLRDDLMEIAQRIAHVYQPQLKNPLLSTTPEQLARALNRIGLHLLVVMDQLPLDLKTYNIQKTYDTIRNAIVTYGRYKKASPYLDWTSKGIYFGRMVTSTNPIALGLLWGATELGKYGAQKLATQLIDRQAIGFLQSVIRVVGYEVAAIYGGDYRYRDPNWCYAVELTQMFANFPASRESLQYAMQEIGRLQLRNEYDRLSLYRSLSAGKVIDRKQTHPELLSELERRKIIELLEKAYRDVLHGKTNSQSEKWKKSVQEHLGLQLSLQKEGHSPTADSLSRRNRQILTCLTSFLLHVKQCTSEEAKILLADEKLQGILKLALTTDQIAEVLQEIFADTIVGGFPDFQPPDLEPADARVDQLLAALSFLNARVAPYSPEAEQLILETGLYFRRVSDEVVASILQAYQKLACELVPENARLLTENSPACARALLYLQRDHGIPLNKLVAIYPYVTIEYAPASVAGNGEHSSPRIYESHLIVAENQVVIVRWSGVETEPELIWRADPTARLENTSSLVFAAGHMTGGNQVPGTELQKIRGITVQAPMTARFQQYFAPLMHQMAGISEQRLPSGG